MGLGAELLGCALLLTHLHAKVSAAGATCKDVNGLLHETGYHYIPGPEACTLCVCDNGNPTLCKAVFCKYKDQESIPNKDCKTFRFGNTCCELICLDDAVSSTTNDRTDKADFNIDLASRIVAFCITSILIIGLFIFMIRLLYQRKLRVERQHRDFSGRLRACSSMGYLDTNSLQHSVQLDDLPCNGSYPLWKPPSNYFPRGEAPPPYEEAVAAARAEQALLSSMSPHTLSPLNFSGTYLTAHNAQTASLVTNSQNGLPASSPTLSSNNAASTSPLISTNNRPLSSPAAHNCYQLNQTESTASDFCSGTCTTSFAVGSNAYENLPTPVNRAGLSHSASSITPQHMAPTGSQLLLPNTQNSAQNYPQHTTLPRQSGAFTISSTLPNSNPAIHRTIPRTLATSGSLKLRREYSMHQSAVPLFDTPLILPKKTTEDKNSSPRSTISSAVIPSSVPSILPSGDAAVRTNAFYDSSCARDKPSTSAKPQEFKTSDVSSTSCNYKPSLAAANEVSEEGSFDSVTCTCNVQALPPLHDEADDYRSECENCKSAQGSRYYVGNDDELVTSPHETMTLQRRPEDTASGVTPQYYRTSLTLPTSTRERTRSTSSRSNWFSAMPESSTESSDAE